MCASPLIYISTIKFDVVTLEDRILTCFIIYRNAILACLTLFVKPFLKKKFLIFYVEKMMKIEKKLRDFLHLKSTKHFVHCKKASMLRNLAEFRYFVKFVSPYKFSTVYNMLNLYVSYINF